MSGQRVVGRTHQEIGLVLFESQKAERREWLDRAFDAAAAQAEPAWRRGQAMDQAEATAFALQDPEPEQPLV